MEGKEIEFSDGFADLHNISYEEIIKGNGFRIEEAKKSINIVHDIRHIVPIGPKGDYHPFAKLPFAKYPLSR